jgi:hypothetical protein
MALAAAGVGGDAAALRSGPGARQMQYAAGTKGTPQEGQDIVNRHRGQDAPSVRGRMAALDLAIGDRIGVCPIHGTAS